MTDVTQNQGNSGGKPKRKPQAEHYLVGPNGQDVEREEEATGIRYVDLASGEVVVQQSGGKAGEPITMWANFGLKTLATNVASQARQNGRDALQVSEVRERFALNETGVWMDRTRESQPVDVEKLAEAAADAMVEGGKITQAQRDAQRDLLEEKFEDEATVKVAMAIPDIRARYNALVGRNVRVIDDLQKIVGIVG